MKTDGKLYIIGITSFITVQIEFKDIKGRYLLHNVPLYYPMCTIFEIAMHCDRLYKKHLI